MENPKTEKLTVRVDKATLAILDEYCTRMQMSRADAVREGICCLSGKRKK